MQRPPCLTNGSIFLIISYIGTSSCGWETSTFACFTKSEPGAVKARRVNGAAEGAPGAALCQKSGRRNKAVKKGGTTERLFDPIRSSKAFRPFLSLQKGGKVFFDSKRFDRKAIEKNQDFSFPASFIDCIDLQTFAKGGFSSMETKPEVKRATMEKIVAL